MAKKTTPKAKSATTTKKRAVKSAATKKRVVKKAAVIEPAFFEFRATKQTVYWVIFGAASITFAIWLFTLDAKVRDLYDQIDLNTYSLESLPVAEQLPAESTEETEEAQE